MAAGAFATVAAFDSDIMSAAGFDRTVRELGSNRPLGAVGVLAIGLLLAIYDVVCALSAPFRSAS